MATQTKKPWDQFLLLSTKVAESPFNTAPAVSGTNYQGCDDYKASAKHEDVVQNFMDTVSGSEFSPSSEIVEYKSGITYEEPHLRPNMLAALGYLLGGSLASTQDGALAAYKHYIKNCAQGTVLKSIAAVLKNQVEEYKYSGLKAESIKLSMEQEQYWKMAVELIGSGKRVASSESPIASPVETSMKARYTKVYIKPSPTPATDIIAAANLSQITDNISQAQNLTSIGARVISAEVELKNNLRQIRGVGGDGYLQDSDYGRRSASVKLSLLANDETELGYFLNQTGFALEFNCNSGQVVAATGAYKFGFILRFPLCRLKTEPLPQGDVGDDALTIDLECEVMDDGTNPAWDMAVYTALATYLA